TMSRLSLVTSAAATRRDAASTAAGPEAVGPPLPRETTTTTATAEVASATIAAPIAILGALPWSPSAIHGICVDLDQSKGFLLGADRRMGRCPPATTT